MAEYASLSNVPNYVKARSPEGLRRAMLRNNVRIGMQLVYHSIQFTNGEWVAWFYEDAKLEEVYKTLSGKVEVDG